MGAVVVFVTITIAKVIASLLPQATNQKYVHMDTGTDHRKKAWANLLGRNLLLVIIRVSVKLREGCYVPAVSLNPNMRYPGHRTLESWPTTRRVPLFTALFFWCTWNCLFFQWDDHQKDFWISLLCFLEYVFRYS